MSPDVRRLLRSIGLACALAGIAFGVPARGQAQDALPSAQILSPEPDSYATGVVLLRAVTDLSAPERLMIAGWGIPVMTILMGGTMLVQQWLTPQQGDPTQRQMMMFMPLVFTYMFLNFPAGLVLYWLVSNLLGITQQYLMLRST